MDEKTLQTSCWYKIQKFLLPPESVRDGGSHDSQLKNSHPGNFERGYFEIEMLVWISVITLLLSGFIHIYKNYKKEHLNIKQEFENEWTKLESQRRTEKNQQSKK